MKADCRVVLDACVLIPMPLADTLLRLAETPRLYVPLWSQVIMNEVTRNLASKWKMPLDKAQRRESELRRHFPEAYVEGFDSIIGTVTNEEEDRHVLAAAIHADADLIVTYNHRHFPPTSLRPWHIEVQGPSTFLRALYDFDASLFLNKLHEQAAAIGVPLDTLLQSLEKNVPAFVQYFCAEHKIDLVSARREAR